MTLDKARELCDKLIGSTGHSYEVVESTPENTTRKGRHLPQLLGGYYVKRAR